MRSVILFYVAVVLLFSPGPPAEGQKVDPCYTGFTKDQIKKFPKMKWIPAHPPGCVMFPPPADLTVLVYTNMGEVGYGRIVGTTVMTSPSVSGQVNYWAIVDLPKPSTIFNPFR